MQFMTHLQQSGLDNTLGSFYHGIGEGGTLTCFDQNLPFLVV